MPMSPPQTTREALTLALYLGLTAPDEEHAASCGVLADGFAAHLDASTVEHCEADALEWLEREPLPSFAHA